MSPPATLYVAAGAHALDAGGDGRPVRALLVRGDRIVWTGADPAAAPRHARSLDFGGGWITPSFVDAHVHATATGLAADGLDLSAAGSVADCLARLRDHAASSDRPVILGHRWEDTTWPEQRPPNAEEITEAAPGRTVLLTRVDAHSCVVDAATLGSLPLAGLHGVDRHADGLPTGWLREAACEAARRQVLARVPSSQVDAARRTACSRAAALGIGAVHEMGHPGLSSMRDAQAWAAGEWPIGVDVWWADIDAGTALRRGLRPGGDLFLDGSIGSRTAAVSGGYHDAPGSGELFHDDEEVAAFFVDSTRAGAGAGVHAIGDRAIDQAVAALEAAAEAVGSDAVRACRHRVEHVEMPSRDHVRRMAALGVVASVQPAFDAAWGGDSGLYARAFGHERALRSNPLGWFDAEGTVLAFGSDSTVTPLDPWGAVAAAERHRGGLAVDRRTALAAHTLGGRYVAGQDDAGPLRPGARADFAVWDADPLVVDDVTRLRCVALSVAGNDVRPEKIPESL